MPMMPNLGGPLEANAHLHYCMNAEPCYVENWKFLSKLKHKIKWGLIGASITSVLFIILRLLTLF